MKKAIAALCLAVSLPGPAVAAENTPVTSPLAAAGSITVSPDEFALFAEREVGGGLRAVAALPEKKRDLLIRLVVRKALAAEGEKQGLDKDPLLIKGLQGWKYKNYTARYWSDTVDALVEVSDRELWDFINPADEYHLGAISLGEGEEGAAAAREVMAESARGADFAELARKYSIGVSGPKGGDIGWQLVPGKMVPEVAAPALRATKIGTLTGPIETPVGFVIYIVREVRTATDLFEKYKESARQQLIGEKIPSARAKRAAELRERASISYPAKSTPGGRGPLAVVDGTVILPETVGTDEHGAMASEISTQVQKLEQLIDAILLVQDAERRGIDKLPELQLGLALERTLILANLTLRRSIREVAPTDAEISAEYRRFYVPEVYALQLISTASREKAMEARGKVLKGEDFSAVTNAYSTGRLKAISGKLPPGPIVDYPPATRAAIEGLPDGGVSGVLEFPDGRFVVVKRLTKKTVTVPPLEEVAGSIRSRLVIRRRADLLEEQINRFMKGLKITINEALLATL